MTDLEREISRLQESINEKKASLASHTRTLEESVQNLSHEVRESVSSKYDQLTSFLNPKRALRDFKARHPWALVGAGIVAGVLLGSRVLRSEGLTSALQQGVRSIDLLRKSNGVSEWKPERRGGIGRGQTQSLTIGHFPLVQSLLSSAAQVGISMLAQAIQDGNSRRQGGPRSFEAGSSSLRENSPPQTS